MSTPPSPIDLIAAQYSKDRWDKAVLDLYIWHNDKRASNFTTALYHLIAKADPINTVKLRLAYPVQVDCYLAWSSASSSDAFFRKYGFTIS